MLNIYVSLRCMGLTYNKMILKRDKIVEDYKAQHKNYQAEINVIDSLFPEYVPGESNPIEFLGKSIEKMKNADVVLIPVDYRKSKGCYIEEEVARIYGLPINSYLYTEDKSYFMDNFVEMFYNETGGDYVK